jgi:hypothetical protein
MYAYSSFVLYCMCTAKSQTGAKYVCMYVCMYVHLYEQQIDPFVCILKSIGSSLNPSARLVWLLTRLR